MFKCSRCLAPKTLSMKLPQGVCSEFKAVGGSLLLLYLLAIWDVQLRSLMSRTVPAEKQVADDDTLDNIKKNRSCGNTKYCCNRFVYIYMYIDVQA